MSSDKRYEWRHAYMKLESQKYKNKPFYFLYDGNTVIVVMHFSVILQIVPRKMLIKLVSKLFIDRHFLIHIIYTFLRSHIRVKKNPP